MKYLLDTHIILWALINDPRIDADTKEIIMNKNNMIYYSTISPWEVEIKHAKNKSFKLSGEQFCFLCDQNKLLNLSIQNKHIQELKRIKNSDETKHSDSFDRMLIAQARSENMILITHDQKFKNYKEKNIMII